MRSPQELERDIAFLACQVERLDAEAVSDWKGLYIKAHGEEQWNCLLELFSKTAPDVYSTYYDLVVLPAILQTNEIKPIEVIHIHRFFDPSGKRQTFLKVKRDGEVLEFNL